MQPIVSNRQSRQPNAEWIPPVHPETAPVNMRASTAYHDSRSSSWHPLARALAGTDAITRSITGAKPPSPGERPDEVVAPNETLTEHTGERPMESDGTLRIRALHLRDRFRGQPQDYA
jgi:hypothetical protein